MDADAEPNPIAFDLPCVGCGYNLRTLSLEERCPECGHSTRETFTAWALVRARGNVLDRDPPEVLVGYHRSLNCAIGLWLLTLLAFAAPRFPIRPGVNDLALLTGALVVGYWAAWLLPSSRCWRHERLIRRALLVIGLIGIGLVFVNERFAFAHTGAFRSAERASLLRVTPEVAPAVGKALILAVPLAYAMTAWQLMQIGWRGGVRLGSTLFAVIAMFQLIATTAFILTEVMQRYVASIETLSIIGTPVIVQPAPTLLLRQSLAECMRPWSDGSNTFAAIVVGLLALIWHGGLLAFFIACRRAVGQAMFMRGMKRL